MNAVGHAGSGPGPITPDGCAVDFYAVLAPAGEAEIVHAAIPPGASVLELGCGTGRILRRLAALGHPVLGVDESADMLARIHDLDTVRSRIEELNLNRAFDAVLLASTLINTPDLAARDAMLDTARRHTAAEPVGAATGQRLPAAEPVGAATGQRLPAAEPVGAATGQRLPAAGGRVVIQRHLPEWFDTAGPRTTERDGIRYTNGEVHRDGPLLTTTIGYEVGTRRWSHTFTTRRLTDGELAEALWRAGFGDADWLTDDRTWLAAPAR